MGKIKQFLNETKTNLTNLGIVSKNILLYGQIFIFAVLTGAAFYLVHIYDSEKIYLFVTAAKNIKILVENAIFGLVLLWCGALLMDYMQKFDR